MSGGIRGRVTYANVMATVAVFIALGGASYAALKIPKNSISGKQLKRSSVGTRHLKADSVSEARLAPNSVGPNALQGNAIDSGKVADGSLGYADLDAEQLSPRLFAHVTSNGVLADSAGVTDVAQPGTGVYLLTFNRNLRGCVATASVGLGFSGSGGSDSYAADASAAVSMNPLGQADRVRVETKRMFNGSVVDPFPSNNSFNLIVAC